ncbi:hypothetical protein L3X38_042007 [Prunus dulcis]|uniref:TTF-type domain-containing protein n=1 Tax=Prunus dulcis TaxID=3755 RepID=A0AAD4YLK2_PRUDU|nr:hypothetical protein L3X38_042007 [Prunus dulcis]
MVERRSIYEVPFYYLLKLVSVFGVSCRVPLMKNVKYGTLQSSANEMVKYSSVEGADTSLLLAPGCKWPHAPLAASFVLLLSLCNSQSIVILRMCSSTICMKELISFLAAVRYGAKLEREGRGLPFGINEYHTCSSTIRCIRTIKVEGPSVADLCRSKEVCLHLRLPKISITDVGVACLLQTSDAHNMVNEMRKPLGSAQLLFKSTFKYSAYFTSPLNNSGSPKRSKVTKLDEILANLPADPGLRPPMTYYNPNFREQIQRAYLQRGPCQPKSQNEMPHTLMGESNRRFLVKWFDSFVWLEYSKEKDAAFCLHCYLFKCDFDKQGKAGSDVFTEKGFKNLRKGPENFRDYVGQVGSLHNKATQHCLPFRGHDESETSSNKDNYVELLQFLADHDEKVRAVVLENAPGNLKYIALKIQKDLVKSCAAETIDAIISDIDDAFFFYIG